MGLEDSVYVPVSGNAVLSAILQRLEPQEERLADPITMEKEVERKAMQVQVKHDAKNKYCGCGHLASQHDMNAGWQCCITPSPRWME